MQGRRSNTIYGIGHCRVRLVLPAAMAGPARVLVQTLAGHLTPDASVTGVSTTTALHPGMTVNAAFRL